MLSNKAQYFTTQHSLLDLLHEELHWMEGSQYTSIPLYSTIIDGLQTLPNIDLRLSQISKDLISKFIELTLQTTQQTKLLIELCISEYQMMQEKSLQIEHCLLKEKDRADGLQQLAKSQLKRLGEWEYEYENLKAEYGEVLTKLDQEKRKVRKQHKQLTKTFLEVRENTQQDKLLLQNLQEQKWEIIEQMQSQKKTNEMLAEELRVLMEKVAQTERQVVCSTTKLSHEERRSQMLLEELAEKDKLITGILQSRKDTEDEVLSIRLFRDMASERQNEERFGNHEQTKKPSFIGTFNLADEIYNLKEDFEPSFHRANSATASDKNSITAQIQEQTIAKNAAAISQSCECNILSDGGRVMMPDLYFAHYLLTVQSVKLKLEEQQLWNIDMREYYDEMVECGTPFYLWDEWIREKLLQLGKRSQ